jgi:hypothetical protein
VSFDWGDYQPYTYPSYLAQNKLPRPDARRVYIELMNVKDERIRELRKLLRLHAVELDDSDTSVRALNEWVRCNVEADPAELSQRWISVLNDVALYLGD